MVKKLKISVWGHFLCWLGIIYFNSGSEAVATGTICEVTGSVLTVAVSSETSSGPTDTAVFQVNSGDHS